MRYTLALVLILVFNSAAAEGWEDQAVFGSPDAEDTLSIISSTDTALFLPMLEAFIAEQPNVTVEYFVTGTSDLDRRVRKTPEAFDVAISSAMDLQLKLANDGHALPLPNILHPSWAQWRQSVFAFTSEPAVIAINRSAFAGMEIPESRQELIEAMRARPEVFRNRVGTYDVRQSGVGYLFATQDARASETFWRLMEVMGSLNARLYCCSGDMIDDLTDGTIAVAYNVLGSYAQARADSGKAYTTILPSDFPTTMMRTALVSKASTNPKRAEEFLQFIVTYQSNGHHTQKALPPLAERQNGTERANIALEPALMTFLDTLKRNKFLKEWQDALIQN
ncbi:ABC transporter substrate-binding protein [Epibacterium ulvae]|uniref:ABC transporter substrate-binding protein n=1 Tax=Epibacterium ulvae TaxID=1156985 RepID=UPI0024914192|nr:extracellular solute-binding protein [Epibacterium ulvae]